VSVHIVFRVSAAPAPYTQQVPVLHPTSILLPTTTMSLTKKDLEDLVKGYKVDLANINIKLDALLSENADLKKLIAARDEEIEGLKLHVNDLEQHNRSWSVRILGLPLTPTEEKSSLLVRDKVYSSVIRPILEGAVKEGDLQHVPPKANDVIEMAHPLRAKDGAIKPIIVHFFARETRALVFRHKKAYAPKLTDGPSKGRYCYSVFEDLTAITFAKMRALAADDRVAASWTAHGQIRYRLVDDPTIRRVANVLAPLDKILG
jgi:hypothetical protein